MDPSVLIDRRLEAPFWPEPVRIVRVDRVGNRFEVHAELLKSGALRKQILNRDQIETLLQNLNQDLRFDADPELFTLGVEAHRIKLGYTFDPFFAVWASRVDPLPHQLEAVYGVLLKKPRVRFMIADDPGAGKTIMAGLFLKEMKYRELVRRVLIVTPANLTDQWSRELKEKFNESFILINRFTSDAHYGETVWERYDQVITSIDFAKREPYIEELRRTRWDLVIVDEAHKLSATRYGREVKKSQRYRLGEVLSQTATHLLFLTATPHQGDDERFRLLLDLLEPHLFASTQLLEEAAREGDNPILIRRLKEDMTDFEGKPLFPPRRVHTPAFRLSPFERSLYEEVTDYVQKHFKRAWDEKKRNVGLAMTVLQRRLASSSYAIARSLENRLRRLERLREDVSELRDRLDDGEEILEEEYEDLPEDERWRLENELVERVTLAKNLPELEAEIRELESLVKKAKVLARLEDDTKFKQLLKVLEAIGEEKLLVFTEHKDTLNFLVRALQKRGYRVTHIDGSMRLEDRVAREREFRDSAQIMVATEAAGEGINLQFCSVMVNYDLPWNPTRLEQRMGRIHRYGQKYEVNIYNLVADGTREGQVLRLLLSKIEAMREELGSERVYDVIGELLSGVNLEQLILEHITGRKTLEEVRAVVESRLEPERVERIREITLEALAKREIDLSRLHQNLKKSELHRLEPEYTQQFFIRALTLLGGEVRRRSDSLFAIRVPYELRKNTNLAQEYPRATFDPKSKLEAELIAPGHPLFDAVIEALIRLAEPALHQGAAFQVANSTTPFCLGYFRLGFQNGLGQTVSRRLISVAGSEDGVRRVPATLLVDARPGTPPADPPCRAAGETLKDWVYENLVDAYLEEVTREQRREIEIRRKYGLKSLDHLISESAKRLAELKLRAQQGEDLDLPIRNEERRLEELKTRKDELEKELDRAEKLVPEIAEPLAFAYVAPLPGNGTPGEESPEARRRVEEAAMRVAIDYELAQGRAPKDVSGENLGYDLESSGRYIEVKGRAGVGPVVLTPNEWIAAGRLGKDYYLYIVVNALTQPQLYVVPDPASRLQPGKQVEVVHYRVSAEDWMAAAEVADDRR